MNILSILSCHRSFSSPGASTPLSQEKRHTFNDKDLPAIPCEDSSSGSRASSIADLPAARPRKRLSHNVLSNRITQLGLSSSDDHLYNHGQEDDKENLQRQEEDFEVPISPLPDETFARTIPDDSYQTGSPGGSNSDSLPSISDERPPPSDSSSSKSASIYGDQHLLNRPSMSLPPYKVFLFSCSSVVPPKFCFNLYFRPYLVHATTQCFGRFQIS